MIRIDACKAGDKEALAELYTTYADKLLGICRHYIKNDIAAQDILHDAFVIIFVSIKELKDESKLEGWMITIVRNLSLKYIQKKYTDIVSLSHIDIEIQDEVQKPKDIELGLLLSAIESLPNGYREVFKLSILDGLSHQEIGELLGINPHSSSSQLYRAKKMLRSILKNYWVLLLLPILIPIYRYILTRNRVIENSGNKPIARSTQEKHPAYTHKNTDIHRTKHPISSISKKHNNKFSLEEKTFFPVERYSLQVSGSGLYTIPLNIDSLQKCLAKNIAIKDSLWHLQRISESKIIVLNENVTLNVSHKKKSPWTFNFGYSSNTGTNGAMSNLNYLSLIDYANGRTAVKLYTRSDLESYYTRNIAFMDSVERARMSLILLEHPINDNTPLGEVAHHYRPKTFTLSINKQLNRKWTFGTGITYVGLKSEFESKHHKTKLMKTQKIDYVGIPLRLTYQIWSKRNFNAYTTGGVTHEIPIHSSLDKKYIMAPDSSYTLKGNIKARSQWSIDLGVGVQYKIFKPFSLYLEPNMSYYFRNGSGPETYRTEHPFVITIPFGLRFTW